MADMPERPVLILWTLESPLIVPARSADHLDLRPATASITAGIGQAYTAIRYAGERQLGDYTTKTRFTITPDPPGSCTGATCTATVARDYVVTGTIPGTAISGRAALKVVPGPLSRITLDPPSASVAAGTGQAYTVTGYDSYGNQVGNVTARTALSISPDGSCARARCMATKAGVHTVTGTVTGTTITAVARLQMIPAHPPWWRKLPWLLVAGALLVAVAVSAAIASRQHHGRRWVRQHVSTRRHWDAARSGIHEDPGAAPSHTVRLELHRGGDTQSFREAAR
jgi:hypothetical protein